MKSSITVREYARLSTELVAVDSLDRAQVSAPAFDWLCRINASFSAAGASLVQIEDRRWLRLDNYVGVVETPCGTRIEILPKHFDDGGSVEHSRRLMQRMIAAAIDLPARETSETDLLLFDAPLTEWVMARFLAALDHLIKRGIRSDYLRIEADERYLRGQLDCVRQMRQPPGRQHLFLIRHDVFLPDRPENRLLKSALERVADRTRSPDSWRLARELCGLFETIPASRDQAADFRLWRADRLMAHYQPVRPWCELILNRQMPLAQVGEWHGISMLFPMERLFERYVVASLRRSLTDGARLRPQAAGEWLCAHDGNPMFSLRPDLLVELGARRWVLDAKWKRLDAANKDKHYGLSQSDFYQLYAYGRKYLGGQGEMLLIYPRCAAFTHALPAFDFEPGLRLWVLPFDLDDVRIVDATVTSLPLQPSKPEAIAGGATSIGEAQLAPA